SLEKINIVLQETYYFNLPLSCAYTFFQRHQLGVISKSETAYDIHIDVAIHKNINTILLKINRKTKMTFGFKPLKIWL
ncbi:MAG: hypothetical protein LBE70_02790, partial [Nitrososphaerota archaeon]|nr:hypothetical protein [Nitrososphaerota archaeon]